MHEKIIRKLPAVLQTDVNKKFFDGTFEQTFSKRDSSFVTGFIGRKEGGLHDPENDFFLEEPTAERTNYQLEPISSTIVEGALEPNNLFFYPDILNRVEFYGGDISNHDRLFTNDFYSFSPPIDHDKYLNFQNYWWSLVGPPTITLEETVPVDIDTDIIGHTNYTSVGTGVDGEDIIFTSGLRVVFTGTNVTPVDKRDKVFTVEGVGRSIRLVEDQEKVLAFADQRFLEWDRAPWDSTQWDTVPTLEVDYITMERGSVDNNTWSRSNSWYHRAVFDLGIQQTGESFPVNAKRAVRPIIEFKRDIELHNFGRKHVLDVNLVAEVPFSDIEGSTSFTVDGVELIPGQKLIFITPSVLENVHLWDLPAFDTTPFEATLGSDALAVQGFIWEVNFVGPPGSQIIQLTQFQSVDELDKVMATQGNEHIGEEWYWDGESWNLSQKKLKRNQPILFQAYNTEGIALDDETAFPGTDFQGNKIFAYAEDPTNPIDSELGLRIEFKSFNQLSDIVFEHSLETDRSNFLVGGVQTEIKGYYYYNNLNANAQLTTLDPQTKSTWQPVDEKSKQRVIDKFEITSDAISSNVFNISATPADLDENPIVPDVAYNGDVNLEIDGVRRVRGVDFIVFSDRVELISGVTLQAGQVVEIFTFSLEAIRPNTPGYYQIPQNLEANPNYLEVTRFSQGEFTTHFSSIIQNQDDLTGSPLGVNNYRDTSKDLTVGRFILQNKASLLKAMFASSSDELNVVEALRLSQKEYSRFKNKFTRQIKMMIDQGFDGPKEAWVEQAVQTIALSRTAKNAFSLTYMIGSGEVFLEEELVTDGAKKTFVLQNFVNVTSLKNFMYVIKDGETLLVDRDYSITDTSPITINFTTAPASSSDVIVKLYDDPAPAFIPATPSKVGAYQVFKPEIITDNTFIDPVNVIIGHDGSRTPVFGDFRDDILIELETRIYNGISEKFRKEYLPFASIFDARPGKFRDTRFSRDEYNQITIGNFNRWAAANKVDYKVNEFFDPNNEDTWNFSEVKDIDGEELPGHWKGIYEWYYDTDIPHLAPWEMLGFSQEPPWWRSEYGNDFGSLNSKLWQDLEAGRIRQGPRIGIDERFARPGLSQVLPVDIFGNLLGILQVGILQTTPTLEQQQQPWEFGDKSPGENAWRINEVYPFVALESIYVIKPAHFGELLWDPIHLIRAPAQLEQIVRDDTFTRVSNFELDVHSEVVDGEPTVKTGYQVFIVDRLLFNGQDTAETFVNPVKGLDVRLGYKLAGFTNSNSLRVFIEGFSPGSGSGNLLIPREDIFVKLHTGPTIETNVYSGVIIKIVEDGYQVFGYDVLNPRFTIIPGSPVGRKVNVRVGGVPRSFTTFEAGRTYNTGHIVKFNGSFFRARITHTATRFIEDNWARLPNLPVTGGVSVERNLDASNKQEFVDYGTTFGTVQEVYNFIVSYGRFLEQEGWQFEQLNLDGNFTSNWPNVAKQFLFWVTTQWELNNFIALSPGAENVVFETDIGHIQNVERVVNGAYSILDKNGVAILPRDTFVNRQERRIEVSHRDPRIGIYLLRTNVNETEHAFTFNNRTVFNDVIYDPLLLSRQSRLTVRGVRTLNWTGKLEAGGYIISGQNLLPNYENLTSTIRDYHNIERFLDNQGVEDLARHLIGFEKREYLENLQLLDSVQFQFYQGLIRQKGTSEALQKLLRSQAILQQSEISVFEEWAFKLGEYGSIVQNQTIEVLLGDSDVKSNPQVIQFVFPESRTGKVTDIVLISATAEYDLNEGVTINILTASGDTGSGATAEAVLDQDGKITDIVVTDGGENYNERPTVQIVGVITSVGDPQPDEAIALIAQERTGAITPDTPLDDVIVIDVDDSERWITKPRGLVFKDLWPVTTKVDYFVPNAGYIHVADVRAKSFAPSGLPELFSRPNSPTERGNVWIAKSDNEDWNVYQLVDLSATVTTVTEDEITFIELDTQIPQDEDSTIFLRNFVVIEDHPSIPEIDGAFNFEFDQQIGSTFRYLIFDAEDTPIRVTTPNTGGRVLFFLSMRFKNISERDSYEALLLADHGITFSFTEGDRVWVDDKGDGGWGVFVREAGDWTLLREQEELIDTPNFKNAFLYNRASKETEAFMPILDSFKGLIPGEAAKNIFYKTHGNPARFTTSTDPALVDENQAFGEREVGRLWWDLSTLRYFYYEQGTNRERSANWNKLFPGSSIDVYEWVKSTGSPDEYTGSGTVRDVNTFVETQSFDPDTQTFVSNFFFWVKDRLEVPDAPGRTINAASVAALIRNPFRQDHRFFAPISRDSAEVANVERILVGSDTILQVNYKRLTNNEQDIHVDWQLVREGDSRSRILDQFWNKMVDSITGRDAVGNPVPDPNLSDLQTFGIKIRPRQTWFRDVFAARRVLVQSANSLLAEICIRDEIPDWNVNVTTQNFWEFTTWFAEGFDPSIRPARSVKTVGALDTLIGLQDGDVVRVEGDRFSLFQFNATTDTFALVGREACAIRLLDSVFTSPQTDALATELRQLLTAFRNRVFVGDNLVKTNLLFFALFNYVLSEQENLDWAFKTTYLQLSQVQDVLTRRPLLTRDTNADLLDYINEVKPFRTKVREFAISKSTEIDVVTGLVTDFDKPPFFDENLDAVRILDENDPADVEIIQESRDHEDWFEKFMSEPDLIRKLNLKIRLDRVGCDFTLEQLLDIYQQDEVITNQAERVVKYNQEIQPLLERLVEQTGIPPGNFDEVVVNELVDLINSIVRELLECEFKGQIFDSSFFEVGDFSPQNEIITDLDFDQQPFDNVTAGWDQGIDIDYYSALFNPDEPLPEIVLEEDGFIRPDIEEDRPEELVIFRPLENFIMTVDTAERVGAPDIHIQTIQITQANFGEGPYAIGQSPQSKEAIFVYNNGKFVPPDNFEFDVGNDTILLRPDPSILTEYGLITDPATTTLDYGSFSVIPDDDFGDILASEDYGSLNTAQDYESIDDATTSTADYGVTIDAGTEDLGAINEVDDDSEDYGGVNDSISDSEDYGDVTELSEDDDSISYGLITDSFAEEVTETQDYGDIITLADDVDYGIITESILDPITEIIDYGLITDSITEILDYGFITEATIAPAEEFSDYGSIDPLAGPETFPGDTLTIVSFGFGGALVLDRVTTTGNGTTTAFAFDATITPITKDQVITTIEGIRVERDDFEVVGNTIVYDNPPPNNSLIIIVIFETEEFSSSRSIVQVSPVGFVPFEMTQPPDPTVPPEAATIITIISGINNERLTPPKMRYFISTGNPNERFQIDEIPSSLVFLEVFVDGENRNFIVVDDAIVLDGPATQGQLVVVSNKENANFRIQDEFVAIVNPVTPRGDDITPETRLYISTYTDDRTLLFRTEVFDSIMPSDVHITSQRAFEDHILVYFDGWIGTEGVDYTRENVDGVFDEFWDTDMFDSGIQGTAVIEEADREVDGNKVVITTSAGPPTRPAVGFRIHYDDLGTAEFIRASNSRKTFLIQDFAITDNEILVNNINAMPTPSLVGRRPGVIWIGSERIEYYQIQGNRLQLLSRGTRGTPTEQFYPSGTSVIDGSTRQLIPRPEEALWTDTEFGLQNSETVQAQFIRQRPGTWLS